MFKKTLKELMEIADKNIDPNVYLPDSPLGRKAIGLMEELYEKGVVSNADHTGDHGGIIILKTKDNKDFSMLVSYQLPVIATDYGGLKEFGLSFTLNDLPDETLKKLKEIAEKYDFRVVSVEDVKKEGVDLETFFSSKYVSY